MQKRRYPGVSPFKAEQKDIFFGRAEDINKLKKLILIRDQVLLYSKSGIGKTSLLNAGVLPLLHKKFITIPVRFNAYQENGFIAPVAKIISSVKNTLKENLEIDVENESAPLLDEFFKDSDVENNLWFWLKKIQMAELTDKKLLFVFDQFEELFSYPEELVTDFKNQYYDITRQDIPDKVLQEANNKYKENDNLQDIIDEFSEEIELKSVFAIRSDRLSELNVLSDKITDIQEVFYELKPLTYAQVEEAIIKPASENSEEFSAKAFNYLPETINKIINELSEKRTQNIETTQLQIVCQQIEDIAIEKQQTTLENKKVEIAPADLPKFDAIFYNFYDSSVKKLPESEQKAAQLLIEDELIRNGVRISLDEEVCKPKLKEQYLQTLVNTHLLRAENNSFGRMSYEVSHDTLVAPISEARESRIQKEEEIRAEKERLIEIQKAQEKQKRQRTIISIISVAAIVAIALAIFGIVMWQQAEMAREEADVQKEKAEQKELEANEALNNLKNSEFSRINTEAEQLAGNKEFNAAAEKLSEAYKWTNDSLELKAEIDNYKRLAGEATNFSILIKEGNSLAKNENTWLKAKGKYQEALNTGFDKTEAKQYLAKINSKIQNRINYYKAQMREFKDYPSIVKQNKERLNKLIEK